MINKNIKQSSTGSVSSKVSKKAVTAGLVGALLASSLSAGWRDGHPIHGPDWIPPGQEKKQLPPEPPFLEAQNTQQKQYDKFIDWFRYEANPFERYMAVMELGPKIPELYKLYFSVPYNK